MPCLYRLSPRSSIPRISSIARSSATRSSAGGARARRPVKAPAEPFRSPSLLFPFPRWAGPGSPSGCVFEPSRDRPSGRAGRLAEITPRGAATRAWSRTPPTLGCMDGAWLARARWRWRGACSGPRSSAVVLDGLIAAHLAVCGGRPELGGRRCSAASSTCSRSCSAHGRCGGCCAGRGRPAGRDRAQLRRHPRGLADHPGAADHWPRAPLFDRERQQTLHDALSAPRPLSATTRRPSSARRQATSTRTRSRPARSIACAFPVRTADGATASSSRRACRSPAASCRTDRSRTGCSPKGPTDGYAPAPMMPTTRRRR